MNTILHFSSIEKDYINEVGSKAFALSEMAKKGFPVPPGFVLTVSFFEPWMEFLKAFPEWSTLSGTDKDELNLASNALKAKCQELSFTDEQELALDQMFSQHTFRQESFFAVRSSSPEEDLEGASFAGGYETSLGVTAENLKNAILYSFASSFDERVFLYKREHGIENHQPRIAIIVQQQIAADSAGVAFSVNPLNNCYDEAVINANFGLGESVVSGVIEPDLFVIDKISSQILQTQIGTKEFSIHLAQDGGVKTIARDAEEQVSLRPQQAEQITELLIRVENEYQHPVDIEWAFFKNDLYLLQVRPITTYLPLSEDMITAPGAPKRLYADSTLIEQGIEQPLSVLGTDFLRYVLNTMTGPMGGSADNVEDGAFTRGGRYYMNLSRSLQMVGPAGGLAPGSAGDETILGIIENIDTTQYIHEKPSPITMLKTISGPLKLLPKFLPVLGAIRNPAGTLDQYHRGLPGQLHQIDELMQKPLSMQGLASELTAKLDYFFYGFGLSLVFPPQIAQHRMKKIFEDDLDQASEHILSLGTSLPGNKTSEMGAMMAKLAESETLKKYNSSETFLQHMEENKVDPQFKQQFNEFVAEFGARCPREIDVATPRLNEDPAILFEQLKKMSSSQESSGGTERVFKEARRKREEAYDTLHSLALAKGKKQAKSLEKMYKIWVTLGGYRETPKHYVIKIVDLFRKRALEVAEAFVKAGRLDERNQIFDLTIEDIDQALQNPKLDLHKIATERMVLINKIKRSHYLARIIDSRGKIFFPTRKATREGELAGVPISSGVVQGRAKVLHYANEKELLPGEILVTRATDPGWTPLFINAGGVILEIGGALQHGAVVAREYGLPCVSGIAQATELLKDGQLIEVDGSNGVVRILDGEMPNFTQHPELVEQKDPIAEENRRKAQAKQKLTQTVLKVIPLLIIPLVLPVLIAIAYMVINLLAGNSFAASANNLLVLWQIVKPYAIGITNIIAVITIFSVIWKNKKRLLKLLKKNQ